MVMMMIMMRMGMMIMLLMPLMMMVMLVVKVGSNSRGNYEDDYNNEDEFDDAVKAGSNCTKWPHLLGWDEELQCLR